jgi:pimeloyl-ACP methyl ester carboxylesterase
VREVETGEIAVEGVRSPMIHAGPPGDSEAVVFVHGNPGSRLDWQDLVGRVGEFGRALAVDMPGFGQADKPREFDYTVEGYATFVAGALDKLGVERVHLVLHDFGGPFGICWAAEHPDAFRSAVLFNSGSMTNRRWHRMAKLWRTPGVGEAVMAAVNRRAWHRALSGGDARPLPEAFLDRMYDDYDPGTRRAVLRLYRATDLPYPPAAGWVATLHDLDRPALVIWGVKDPYVGPRRAEALKRAFPSAEMVMLDDSGHFPFADNPQRTVELVVPFLRTRMGAASRL